MAKNDLFLIDGIIEDRCKNRNPSSDIGEIFELFAMEQILKEYDLSRDEILSNCVDGKDDGGIDYIAFFVNGHMIEDPSDFLFPRNNAVLELYFVSCKHADSFKLAPVDSLYASLDELLNLGISNDKLSGDYNGDILKKRSDLRTIYKKIAAVEKREIKAKIVYICRGIVEELGENIQARAHQVEASVKSSFRDSSAEFFFFGCSELLMQYRKVKQYDIELPFEKSLSKGEHGIFLIKLQEYFHFISDEDGKLKRYLFDTNVRAYMGINRTNQDILQTLNDVDSPDFWLLNNGITMIVDHVSLVGETVNLRNVQIVNGLQTSETIYNYFSEGGQDPKDRCVLIKVLKISDSSVRDSIIKATNNQTEVTVSALHATDKIQKDIEEVLLSAGLYYERRPKFYENQDVDPSLIVTPLSLASTYVSVIQKVPATAAKLKQKFMNNPEQYSSIFSENTDLKIWSKLALLYKKTDAFLHKIRPKYDARSSGAKFYKYIRQPLMLLLIACKTNTFAYSVSDVIKLDITEISDSDYEAIWPYFDKIIQGISSYNQISTIPIIIRIFQQSGIPNIQIVKQAKSQLSVIKYKQYEINEEFLFNVKSRLPNQPWPQGIHRAIAEELGCAPSKVYQAIDILISKKIFKEQIDGILYD